MALTNINQLNHIYREYVFYHQIEAINKDRAENGLDSFTVRQVDQLHDQIAAMLGQRAGKKGIETSISSGRLVNGTNKDASNDTADEGNKIFLDTMNAVLDPYNPNHITVNETAINQQFTQETHLFDPMRVEHQILGYNTEGQLLSINNDNHAWDNIMLPISPYDADFRNSALMMENAPDMLYVTEEGTHGYSMYRASHKNTIMYASKARGNHYEQIGSIGSDYDKCGIAQLAPYMSKEEYEEVKDWAAKSIQNGGALPQEAINNSIAVLEYLQSAGYEYTIKEGTRPGEIEAQIARPYAKIRVMDTAPNHAQIGHTNVDGSNWYLATNEHNDKERRIELWPTQQDTVDLVKFALGNTVYSPEDQTRVVGQTGTYMEHTRNMSFLNGKTASFVYRSLDGTEKNQIIFHREREENAENIHADYNDPEQYIENAVNSARVNFYAALDVDSLIDAWQNDTEPEFSTDPDIEIIQEGYWEVLTGQADTLLKPGTDMEAYRAKVKEHANMSEGEKNLLKVLSLSDDEDDLNYDKEENPAEIIRKHAYDMTNYYIGRYPKTDTITANSDDQIIVPERVSITDQNNNADGTVTYTFKSEKPGAQEISIYHADGSKSIQTIGTTFDLVNTAYYMDSNYTPEGNQTALIKNIQAIPEFDEESFLGNDDYNTTILKNRLLVFDESSSEAMCKSSNDYIKKFGEVIRETIAESGCDIDPNDIVIDKNGVVQYKAYMHTHQDVIDNRKNKGVPYPNTMITGTVGQIFAPDDKGMITTKYAGTKNNVIIPGYTAEILPDKPGEHTPVADRLRVHGYEDEMTKMIRETVKADVLMATKTTGSSTNLNTVYKHLYDNKFDIGYPTSANVAGMPVDATDRITKSMSQRIRFSKNYADSAGIDAYYRERTYGQKKDEVINDNFHSDWRDLNETPISTLIGTDALKGILDPTATTDAKNQGLTCYLVDGTVVNEDNSVTPSPDPDARTSLMNIDQLRYQAHDPFDRRLMAYMNLTSALRITEQPVMAAQMTFGGYTFDDGYVISKKFAQENGVEEDSEYHDLRVGDKVSDFHGNKGVISLVVDPDAIKNMNVAIDSQSVTNNGYVDVDVTYNNESYVISDCDPSQDLLRQCQESLFSLENGEEALNAVLWFEKNPDLQVVSAPYSYPSRFNGGSARELMEQPVDLISPDGTVMKGCAGYESIIITDKTVAEKTTVYDSYGNFDEGRKASSQFAWTCASKNCPAIMRELYGTNTSGVGDLKEYLLVLGYDLDGKGTMHQWTEHRIDENRTVFKMPEELPHTDQDHKLKLSALTNKFTSDIAHKGGYMELPFPLTLKNDKQTPEKDGKFLLPVMSSHLRSENRLEDGHTISHTYTKRYVDIYAQACRYADYTNQINGLEARTDLSVKDRKNLDKMKIQRDQCVQSAQRSYDSLANKIAKEKLTDSKHNIFRDRIMSHPAPNSATAVWTEDPTLKLNEVAMSPEMARAMHVKKNGSVLVWRDPLLRDSGVRYLNVKIKDGLTGIAVNPAIDQSFDGDFDGDSVAVVNLTDPEAVAEAKEKFSMENNLLNMGALDENHQHPLSFNTGLDLKTMAYLNPELKQTLNDLTEHINKFESNETLSKTDLHEKRIDALNALSDAIQKAFTNDFGTACVKFGNIEEHLKSLDDIVITQQAKGSVSKLEDYAKYLAVHVDRDENGYIKSDTLVDLLNKDDPRVQQLFKNAEMTGDKLVADREDDRTVMLACAIKAFGTGTAGAYSQRGMRMLRNDEPNKILELTYPVTQATLQGKHDAEQVYNVYSLMNGAAKALWKGEKVEKNREGEWGQKWANKKPIKMTRDEWVETATQLYKDGFGIEDINTDYLADIADKLCDSNGLMLGIEDPDLLDKKASPLDRLAYPGSKGDNMAFLKRCADNELNLFASDCLKHGDEEEQTFGQVLQFTPQPMYDACLNNTEAEILSKDCQKGYTRKNRNRIAIKINTDSDDIEAQKTGTDDEPIDVGDLKGPNIDPKDDGPKFN